MKCWFSILLDSPSVTWVIELLGYLGVVKEIRKVLGGYNKFLLELKSH